LTINSVIHYFFGITPIPDNDSSQDPQFLKLLCLIYSPLFLPNTMASTIFKIFHFLT
jgi:hypothetical protein